MNQYKYLLLICLGLLFACEKEIKNPPNPAPEEPGERERIRADIYDYFNKYSLWTEQIPDLDEQGRLEFVKKYSSNQSLLTALKNMTPFHSGYSGSIDRFSFIDESGAAGNANSSYADGIRMDTEEGYGLSFGWGVLSNIATKAYPVIYFVEGGSPAAVSGITRGAIVYALNGDEDVGVELLTPGGTNMNENERRRILRKLEIAFEAETMELKVETPIGVEETHALIHKTYDIDPVILDSVYVYPDKNIGYLAYSSFEEVWPITHRNYTKLEGIFNSFKNANIKDLILDLRYNTGGYVRTAEYLAHKLVNAAEDGKLMFKYDVNEYLATSFQHKSSFQDVYFNNDKNNNQPELENSYVLELENIYVLVTEQTASAAELLISAIQPYLNVTIIAETDRTYGKPVGFFPEEITDDVTLWVTSFKTINADGYTDYWNGMDVDEDNIDDYIFKDFGDAAEDMIAKALDIAGIPASSMRASSQKNGSAQRGVKLGIINQPRERNMLKTRED